MIVSYTNDVQLWKTVEFCSDGLLHRKRTRMKESGDEKLQVSHGIEKYPSNFSVKIPPADSTNLIRLEQNARRNHGLDSKQPVTSHTNHSWIVYLNIQDIQKLFIYVYFSKKKNTS